MLNIALHGAAGRVGRRLIALISQANDLRLAAAIVRPESSVISIHTGVDSVVFTSDLPTEAAAQVMIDFSSPAALPRLIDLCIANKLPLVCATTGLDASAQAALDSAAKQIAVLHATNTSLGVAVLNRLAEEATRLLGETYDLEIVETHHKHKKDAPSGTAKTLLARVQNARPGTKVIEGRAGHDAARGPNEIGMHSLRIGDVVGTHTLNLATDGERLELTHIATSRDTFAHGALRAARWIVSQKPGRYRIEDVLGL